MKSKLAVLKTSPETVMEDYGRLMRMAGYQDVLPQDQKVVLQVGLSWDVWYPACSTTPWQLEGVIQALLADGYPRESLVLAQNRSGTFRDRVGEVNNGLASAAERQGFEFTRLYEPPVNWISHKPRGEMLVLDKMFGDDGIPVPDVFLSAGIIHLPTMKTDAGAGVAGAMMNAAAGPPAGDRRRSQGDIHEILVDLLTLQKEIHGGLFAVMDGTICGDGNGPRAMMPYEKDYILASADQVAIDAVAARMMGFDPMKIRYLRLAHERGLGCADVDSIEIAGEDINGVDFQFRGGQAGRSWPEAASRLYLDYFWYPFIGRPRVYDMAETKWGQLQQTYLPPGAGLENQGRSRGSLIAVAAAAGLLGMGAVTRVARLARRNYNS
ncbi:MAG: DUF362 domain-containing protein [Actinomycetota bacterium]|nr:DUF362 domain-containing protein [Actinomycetota bacterium]MCL6093332.1 DUF362 domain-containing protein [Actinomycetota bacterium]MDA8166703.1 DUF362 domain-containing protein [Actinomycetota bacterium]